MSSERATKRQQETNGDVGDERRRPFDAHRDALRAAEVIDLNYLGQACAAVLADKEAEICSHIDRQARNGRRGGIESAFAKPFIERLARDGRILDPELTSIAVEQLLPLHDRRQDPVAAVTGGRVRTTTIRLPRLKADLTSDLAQLTADYRKFKRAERRGILLVFLHGPLVEDAASGKALWRAFHNQAFIEMQVAKAEGLLNDRDEIVDAGRALGWMSVCTHASIPNHGRAALAKRVGAVLIECD